MYSAIGVEPTKLTAAMSGCARIASTAALSPCTTLNTPSGSPACFSSSAISSDGDGSRSLGFSTKLLPQAMAIGNIHIGTMHGKLNGVMPAHTPSGWRSENWSIPVEICSEYSPLSRCGMPVANSTTSSPRTTSPLASSKTLPCSRVISRASASWFFSSSSLNLNITRARRSAGVSAQAGNAAFAACTAASTVDASPRRTRPVTSPVAGLNTSLVRPAAPPTRPPPIQWVMSERLASLLPMASS